MLIVILLKALLNVILLNVILLNFIMLNIIHFNAILVYDVQLNVILLNDILLKDILLYIVQEAEHRVLNVTLLNSGLSNVVAPVYDIFPSQLFQPNFVRRRA
jgi:hypothetical protein